MNVGLRGAGAYKFTFLCDLLPARLIFDQLLSLHEGRGGERRSEKYKAYLQRIGMLEAETKELRLLFTESDTSHFVVLKLSEVDVFGRR